MANNKEKNTGVTDENDKVEKYIEAYETFCKDGRNSISKAEHQLRCAWLEQQGIELYSSNKISLDGSESLNKGDDVVNIPTKSHRSKDGNVRTE